MNGLELIKFMDNIPGYKLIPKIMYSGTISRADKEKCFANGASDCMSKSSTFENIRADVKKMITYCKN
jgi:CheY-like chemotaxis protein